MVVSVLLSITCSKLVNPSRSDLLLNAHPLISISDVGVDVPYAWLPPNVRKIILSFSCSFVVKNEYSSVLTISLIVVILTPHYGLERVATTHTILLVISIT